MLIGSKDIAGLRRLITTALKRGTSPKAIVEILERALANLYSSRGGFTKRDLDISFLVKAIGGPRLLYALQKSHGLASVSTVHRRNKIPQLLASVGEPSPNEFNANLSTFLHPSIKPPPKSNLLPNIIMVDGVALDTKCRYCTKRNIILGLCREHAKNVDVNVSSMEAIDNVHTALFDPPSDDQKVCFGSDATVVALAPYARKDHYSAIPLVVSPSDKTEKAEALAKWMRSFLDCYKMHEFGKQVHGPIGAIGSDGDSTFRRAKHILCMTTPLDPTCELGLLMRELKGLNLHTSPEGILGTCDPKHVFKRFATLLRNTAGLIINDTNVKPQDIIFHLAQLPEMSIDKAQQLLDPSDKQNVPKAVSLIQHLYKLRNLPKPDHPAHSHRRQILNFLAEFLATFVFPFISVEKDLFEQLLLLSKFAHLAAALYIRHGTACLTGALYADAQAIVKNIFFTVARLQIIDPNLPFYIILEGTDRLEVLFCECRTQDHARNFDIEQLSEKLGVAMLIDAAFERNPDLDRGHRRLSLKGSLGIDRINPQSWIGNARVGDVDVLSAWVAGREAANSMLEDYFGKSVRCDFTSIFSKQDHDLLRPLGTWVGTQPTDDDERSEKEPEIQRLHVAALPADESSAGPTSIMAPFSPPISQPQVNSISSDQPTSCESVPFPESSTPSLDIPRPNDATADADPTNIDDSFEDLGEYSGVDIEDFFPESVDSDGEIADEDPPTFSRFLPIEGKNYLKTSLVAALSSSRSKKVTMRTLRAQGVAIEDLQISKFKDILDPSEQTNDNLMKASDLGAFLIHSQSTICMAVLEARGFHFANEKFPRTVASFDQLSDKTSSIKVIGQIVELVPLTADPDFWIWTKKYLQLDVKSKDTRMTRAQLIIEIQSPFLEPLHDSNVSRYQSGENVTTTWQISSDYLEKSLNRAWERLNPETNDIMSNINNLPSIINPDALPYRNQKGMCPTTHLRSKKAHPLHTK